MRTADWVKHVGIVLLTAMAAARADIALVNINGYTPTGAGLREFNMLVISDNGRVLAVGDQALLNAHPDAVRIDGRGRTVLPGLTDAHAHVYGLGFLAVSLDLTGSPSLREALRQIAEYSASVPHSSWIQGRGWNQVLWPVQEFPRAADIDDVVSERPVWLRRIDGHAGWANSKAIEIAGIDNDTPDPIGGNIVRDASGKATGILIDKAMALVAQHIPAPDKDDIRAAYLEASRYLLSLGMTSVHDAGINIREAEVYMSMADDGELGMRIYAMLSDAGENLDAMGAPLQGYGDDRLEIAAVKIYADGALGSRGAALIEPYSDDVENRGLPFFTADELTGFTRKANGMGFQAAIHAIGDLGNRMALDAFDAVQGGKPSPLRNRIEHAQIIALADLPRFAKLGVIASMQPTHATSDMNMAEDRVGAERIKGGYAWRRLLESGAVIASGSDFPVELANPWHGLYAAVTRQSRDGEPEGGWYADQALTRAEALHTFTLAAAYAAHQEDRLGSLEPGKWADFVMIDRDYFDIPASEIDDIQVLETWVGGKRVFQAGGTQ
ncbi:MAG: amidohydrolase [Gammaproteobacteria bacterium]|nr:amidohydrolase [Gammaproteobacteria bacterium]MDH3553032.1 amidohydrolase [Gammaproteobacteria bacterium]